MRKPRGYWTYNRCKSEALFFNSKEEFKRKSPSAYNRIRNKGWLDEVCSHMKPSGHKYKRCVYAIICNETKEIYIGITCNFEKRRHQNPTKAKLKQKGKYCQLTPYIDAEKALELEWRLIQQYHKKKGWICLNSKKKRNSLGFCNNYYDK